MELRGAEIFSTGLWNGRRFSEDALDDIVRSFDFFKLGGKVPLKLGHDGLPDDAQPALGWIDRVYREGSVLKADVRDIPTVVFEAIKKGMYKFCSIELLQDVTADTRVIPFVLDAVALLGATKPAVGVLKDLQALTMAKGTGLQCASRLVFRRDDPFTGDRNAMGVENDDDKLKKEIEQLRAQNEKIQKDRDGLAARAAEGDEYRERFTKLTAETKDAKVKAHRAEIADLFKAAVDGKKILPRTRELFYKRFAIESDDDGVMRIPLADVRAYIAENPNPNLKVSAATGSGDPDEIPVGGPPDRELVARAARFCRDRNLDATNWVHIQTAVKAIMTADPAVGERYKTLPDDRADGKYEA